MRLIDKKLFTKQPDANTGVLSMAAYCSINGDIMKYSTYTGSSDAFKDSTIQFSYDGGKTYTKPVPDKTRWKVENGMMTKYFKLTALDKKSGRFYMFYNQGLLPSDKPEDGLKNWQLYYTMSEDKGRSFKSEKPVVLKD